ncbi:hypothetical protein COT42_07420 [Candidatus Saganbacteria bacterium CG08_land_8_20_14_0_20_45_16]|uniref:Polymerase beta nucleotidyltransferase domain-containing protein n=1 Tax=Candidatus Saganbacteria bacterium CG08_land_8_20_14_0_20_45_16 TaxID=2014293 RepID=A0A2H0XUK0_UNCSA|nr:MAG: hypothetical protein COT42_07420 [Candidatus Saganbacteria bacterium CG08_land_8_20_14_0_20_45_16]
MTDLKYDNDSLIKLCEKHNLKLLVLHGSYAKGQATPKSDLDIGILAKIKIGFKEYSAIMNDFGELFGDKFDPAFLNNAEPMICRQVALGGRPLYEQQKGDFAKFKNQALARYLDTKKFRDLEKDYIKQAIGRLK